MNIVEQTFQRTEYEKFVEQRYISIPEKTENHLRGLLKTHKYRIDTSQYHLRLSLLLNEKNLSGEHSYYVKRFGIRGVKKMYASNGEEIYRIPVMCFPINSWRSHYTNCYLINGKEVTLIDTGSTLSEPSFEEGLNVVKKFFNKNVSVNDIDNIIITHAHIDHTGGLSFLYPKSGARVLVHEADAEAVENSEKRHREVHSILKKFLKQAGIPLDLQAEIIEMHGKFKDVLSSNAVTGHLKEGDSIINEYEIIHTPGHCPGSICIKNGDVLFLGDHIISGITPHQFPRLYMDGIGLIHYIPSLLKICSISQNIRLGLPAHNELIPDIKTRALEIINSHHERLGNLLSLLKKPISLYDVSSQYFSKIQGKDLDGYDKILAIEEVAAHIEYLVETLGCVKITNPGSENDDYIPLYAAD